MTWLNKVGDFLTQFDIPGRGSDENWNGDDLWQIYSEDGGQGQAIRAKGRPLLVDAKTLPFQMGLGRGFSGKSNILGGIKDLLGAAGLGANAFKNGHDTKLIDIAVEAVKGNAGADNKPVVETATSGAIYENIEQEAVSVMSKKDVLPQNDRIDTVVVFFERRLKSDSEKIAFPNKKGVYPPIDTFKIREVYRNGKKVKVYGSFD